MERDRFDFLRKLFQGNIRPQLEAYVNDSLRSPLLIEFDPTTACNFACPECISAGLLNKASIPSERIAGLMSEFARGGVKGIIFIGGGEPLAHKCMPAPLRDAHNFGMAVGLTTNGSLIERHLDTIAECVDWTRVSVDAGTATTFDSVRPNHLVKGFDRVLGQMQKLAAVKRGALGYSFLIIQRRVCGSEQGNATAPNGDAIFTNAHEIGEAARRAKEIGCDYFEYKPMVDSAHYLMPFSEDLRAIVREQDAICRRLETDDFAIIAPASMELLSVADDPRQPKKYAICPAMELRTLVTPSGVYPCPYHRGREDKRLGPVPEMPFDIWWQSDERKRAMARTDPRTDCNFYCIRHRTNVVVHALRDVQEEGVDLLSRIERSECPPNDPFF